MIRNILLHALIICFLAGFSTASDNNTKAQTSDKVSDEKVSNNNIQHLRSDIVNSKVYTDYLKKTKKYNELIKLLEKELQTLESTQVIVNDLEGKLYILDDLGCNSIPL